MEYKVLEKNRKLENIIRGIFPRWNQKWSFHFILKMEVQLSVSKSKRTWQNDYSN